jgi:diguanylate cyclase (GGDEF)-like protein/PAS domain S-box-containing protein
MMSIPQKTLLIIGITFTGLLATLYTASSSILLANIKEAENHSTRQSIAGVLNIFAQGEENFSTRFADWSSWDDAYAFVQDGNSDFIRSNLVPGAIANLNVDLVLFLRSSGQVVFGTEFDRRTQRNLPVSVELIQRLAPQSSLVKQTLSGNNQTGIIVLPKGAMLITLRPILTSEGKGPIQGVLVFGRYLDAQGIAQLSKTTRLPLAIHPLSSPQLPADFQTVRSSLTVEAPIVQCPLSEQVMGGYVLLKDINQQPALLLRMEIPREIYQQGRKSLNHLTLSLLLTGLIGAGIILLLLRRLALFLLERQRAEAALQQAEEKYHSIFENGVTGIFQTTPDGRYLSANHALAQIYGYESPEALIAEMKNIGGQLYVEHDRRQEFIRLLDQQESITKFESQVYRKDGSIIWIAETARAVRNYNQQVLYYEGFVTDVTETKQIETALRESEERYALAIEGTNDGLWDWNVKLNRIFFSSRWKAMLGYADHEISYSPEDWLSRIHPDDVLRVNQEIAHYVEGSITQFASEHRMQHKDGHYVWVLNQGFAVRDPEGKAYRLVGSQTDISHRKYAEEQLLYDALHDSLTGLPNRVLFMDRLGHAIQLVKRHQDYFFAVLFIDLDRFKVINDSLGHMAGDQLLVEIAQRLGQCLRSDDTFARLGGDEFVILLEDIENEQQTTQVANRIQQELKQPFNLHGHEVFATASIGIIFSTTGYDRPEDLLRDADTAMYRAKGLGRNCHQVFDPSMHEHAMAVLHIENDLRRAIENQAENQEFQLYYQPIVSLRSDRINGFEALLRWQHPTRGMISPADFIPIAEETGLIIPLGQWVLRQACHQMRQWQIQFPVNPPLTISVNISSRQFTQLNLPDEVQQILQETGLSAQTLKLEITESTVMENAEAAAKILQRLRELHVHLSIDDFGTGYSSLGYLHRFPVDTLKIDRSFINSVETDLEKIEIIRTVINLAWNLGMDVVAEGVETQKQLAHLKALNCENGQGYLFSKPLNTAAVDHLLTQEIQPRQRTAAD